MTSFWRRWMAGWCAFVGAFGLMLTGAAFEATEGPTRALFAVLGAPDLVSDAPLRFSIALLGSVTMTLGGTVWTAARAAERLGEAGRPVWGLLTAVVAGWYVIDSTLSVATGFWLNAASNTAILAAFLLPVWRSGVLGGTTARKSGPVPPISGARA